MKRENLLDFARRVNGGRPRRKEDRLTKVALGMLGREQQDLVIRTAERMGAPPGTVREMKLRANALLAVAREEFPDRMDGFPLSTILTRMQEITVQQMQLVAAWPPDGNGTAPIRWLHGLSQGDVNVALVTITCLAFIPLDQLEPPSDDLPLLHDFAVLIGREPDPLPSATPPMPQPLAARPQ